VLVTTTWNTSAADPKRAIARADALILAPQSLPQKHPSRTDQTQSPKIRLKSFVGFMAEGHLFGIYKQSR